MMVPGSRFRVSRFSAAADHRKASQIGKETPA